MTVRVTFVQRNDSQSNSNRKLPKQSGLLRGVKREKKLRLNPFTATICINGRNKHLGYFPSEELAYQAYLKATVQQFGEFVCAETKETYDLTPAAITTIGNGVPAQNLKITSLRRSSFSTSGLSETLLSAP
jgi:hypothetical protein